MLYYFAPLEGITDYLYRTIHHRHFPGVDRYYTPFLSPTLEGPALTKKDLREILPENNREITLIPQILTNNAAIFLRGAQALMDYGYTEVNLNLGCPSGTVAAKGKGSGFLDRREDLERFLDEIYEKCPMDISIKTRLERKDPDGFYSLLELYNRYPIKELTIHPRIREDMYKHPVRMEYFRHAQKESKAPLCLSGGISTLADIVGMVDPPEAIMLGRSLVANPALVMQAKGTGTITKEALRAFHDEFFEAAAIMLGTPKNTMFRMKEIWALMAYLFDNRDKHWKDLRKATSVTEYQGAVARLFRDCPLREHADVRL